MGQWQPNVAQPATTLSLQALLSQLVQPVPTAATLLAALQQQPRAAAPAPPSRHLSLELPGSGDSQLLSSMQALLERGGVPQRGSSVESASMPEQAQLEQLLALLQRQQQQ